MSRCDPIRELSRLVRHPDMQCHNIGLHLRAHAAVLGPALALDEHVLQGMSDQPDHLLAPKIEVALRRLKDRLAAQEAEVDEARARAAARELAARARWNSGGTELDPAVLLGDLLVDRSVKYVGFDFADMVVAVERKKLVATVRVISSKPDLIAFVDTNGLHVRWNHGRGGLNWHPQQVLPGEHDRVLHVPLRRPPLRRPAWSWDALLEASIAP